MADSLDEFEGLFDFDFDSGDEGSFDFREGPSFATLYSDDDEVPAPAPVPLSRSAAFTDRVFMRERYEPIPQLVTSDDMFAGSSWARLKFAYEKSSPLGRRFDYESYRGNNDTCHFYVVDTLRPNNTKDFRERHGYMAKGHAVGYTKRRYNSDHHMIPLPCCDKKRRSMVWMPLDINLRARSPRSFPNHGQPVFADYIEAGYERLAQHPINMYYDSLHGKDNRFTMAPMRGYYPLAKDLKNCLSTYDEAMMWATRDPLTLTDGFDILKKLASADPDSWANVMKFLPFNEKCGWSQYLSSSTAESVYGVAYPTPRVVLQPKPTWDCTRFMFSSSLMGGLVRCSRTFGSPLTQNQYNENRATTTRLSDWLITEDLESSVRKSPDSPRYRASVIQRYAEVRAVGAQIKSDRQKRPFFHLWRLKTVYDISNFCNRHALRVETTTTICNTLHDQVTQKIFADCAHLSQLGVTKVVDDGSHGQAHLVARHAENHYSYMHSWRDLALLTGLATNEGEPTQAEQDVCFNLWHKHSMFCNTNNKQPQFSAPMLHTQWTINRIQRFSDIVYRNMGKKLNDFLALFHDQECAVAHDISWDSSCARTTTLDLLAFQISACIDIDMEKVYAHCVRFNYQEMACPVLPTDHHGNHACGNPSACIGCDCHFMAKAQTLADVNAMYKNLDAYQERNNVDYGKRFTRGTFMNATTQQQNHNGRKRVHTAISRPGDVKMNVDMDTVPGLESLITGTYYARAAPPIGFDKIRRVYGITHIH